MDQMNDALREMVILEDLKISLPEVVRIHVEEQRVKTTRLATEMADDYELVHKSKFGFHHQFQLMDRNWGKKKSSSGKDKRGLVGDSQDSLPQHRKETHEDEREIKSLRYFYCNK